MSDKQDSGSESDVNGAAVAIENLEPDESGGDTNAAATAQIKQLAAKLMAKADNAA